MQNLWQSKPLDHEQFGPFQELRKDINAVEAWERQTLPQRREDMLVRGNPQATNWVVWVHPTVWYILPKGEEYLRRCRNGGYG